MPIKSNFDRVELGELRKDLALRLGESNCVVE